MEEQQAFVAIVDDDPSVCAATCRLLRAAGFRAAPFASAESFLEAAEARAADCLILDLRLPGMNGLELYAELRARGTEAPAILITADVDPDGSLQTAASEAGIQAILSKPFEADALLGMVQTALAQRSP